VRPRVGSNAYTFRGRWGGGILKSLVLVDPFSIDSINVHLPEVSGL